MQWFFKEEVRSHGWYTAELRRYATELHRQLAADQALLLEVAELLFASRVLEDKALAVTMLQPSLGRFGSAEFRRFETWLGKVVSWADHDALAMYLIGPLLVADPRRVTRPLRWASSPSRWLRRAAAVWLIHGVRRGLFHKEAVSVTERLLADPDDEVIPYLASLPGVASYNPESCTLTFRRQPGFLTLYADKVYLTQVKDSDSRSLIQAQTVFEAGHPDLQLDVQEVSTRKFKMIQY